MPTVIADTSVLQYLHQLEQLHLLHQVWGNILVPQAVADELAEGRRIGVSLPNLTTLPWIMVEQVAATMVLPLAWDLGRGERAVLALALEKTDAVVMVDDGLARRAAKHLQIPVMGTLGLLLKAKQLTLIPAVASLLDQLDSLNFRVDAQTRQAILRLADESS